MKKNESILVHIDESTRQIMDKVNNTLISSISEEIFTIKNRVDEKSEDLTQQINKVIRKNEKASNSLSSSLTEDLYTQLSDVKQTLKSEVKNILENLQEIDKLKGIVASLKDFSVETKLLLDLKSTLKIIAADSLSLNNTVRNLSQDIENKTEKVITEASQSIFSAVKSQTENISDVLRVQEQKDKEALAQLTKMIFVIQKDFNETISQLDEKIIIVVNEMQKAILLQMSKQGSTILENYHKKLKVLENIVKLISDSSLSFIEKIDFDKAEIIGEIDSVIEEVRIKSDKIEQDITEVSKEFTQGVSSLLSSNQQVNESFITESRKLQGCIDQKHTKELAVLQSIEEKITVLLDKQLNSFDYVFSQITELSNSVEKIETKLSKQETNVQSRFNAIDKAIESVSNAILHITYLVTPFWKRSKMNKDED